MSEEQLLTTDSIPTPKERIAWAEKVFPSMDWFSGDDSGSPWLDGVLVFEGVHVVVAATLSPCRKFWNVEANTRFFYPPLSYVGGAKRYNTAIRSALRSIGSGVEQYQPDLFALTVILNPSRKD